MRRVKNSVIFNHPLRWSASCLLPDNLARVTGGLLGYRKNGGLMNDSRRFTALNCDQLNMVTRWMVGQFQKA